MSMFNFATGMIVCHDLNIISFSNVKRLNLLMTDIVNLSLDCNITAIYIEAPGPPSLIKAGTIISYHYSNGKR